MDQAAPSIANSPAPTAHDGHGGHEAHGETFYAETNPKYFGLPLGVLLAAGVAAIAVCITLVKFFGGPL